MRTSFLTLIVVTLGLGACDPSVLQPEEDYVAVVGRSTLSAAPDLANFSVVVSAIKDTAANAQDEVSKNASALVADLMEFGIAAEDLATKAIYVGPDFDEVVVDGQIVDKQIGFEAHYSLRIRTDKLDKLGDLLNIVVRHASYYEDLDYSLKDKAALHQRVRKSAIENARTKAREYASAVGRTLGKAEIVEESDVNRYRLSSSFGRRGGGMDEITVTARKRESGFTVPVIPPNIEVALSIYAKYRLE